MVFVSRGVCFIYASARDSRRMLISNQGSTFTPYESFAIDYDGRFFTHLEIDNWWNWAMRSPASLSAWVPEMDEALTSPRNVADLVYDFPSIGG